MKAAVALQAPGALARIKMLVVLGNDDSTFRQQLQSGNQAQRFLVGAFHFVRWIEEAESAAHPSRREFTQSLRRTLLQNLAALRDLQRGEIFADDADRLAAALDEVNLCRAAAQRLDADRTGSGEQIDEDRAFEIARRRKHVEQCLFEPVIGGTGIKPGQRLQGPAAKLSGDHSHQLSMGQSGLPGRRLQCGYGPY